MKRECYTEEELAEILALPPDDPRLAHAAECPACRSLLLSYRAFMKPGETREPSRREEAREKLGAFLDGELCGSKRATARARGRSPLRSRRLRALLAVAGVAALLLIVVRLPDRPGRSPVSGVLRETGRKPGMSPTVEWTDAETARLSWHAFAGADAYRVVIYDADLAELYRTGETAGTSLTLALDEIPGASGGQTLFWRVVALEGGDESTASSLEILRKAGR